MKRILYVLLLLVFPAICFAQPSIVFEKEKQDFGIVQKGTPLEYTFEFTNQGTEDLDISKVVSS